MPECLIIDRQQTKFVLLSYLFIYNTVKQKAAGGGVFQKRYHIVLRIPAPGGLLRAWRYGRTGNIGQNTMTGSLHPEHCSGW